jgi:hypothetical protein
MGELFNRILEDLMALYNLSRLIDRRDIECTQETKIRHY